jgi:hypothetical protein
MLGARHRAACHVAERVAEADAAAPEPAAQ